MNPITIPTLATGFTVTGVVLGLPSIAVLLLCAVNAFRNQLNTGASASSDFGKSPDALLLMLKGMTEAIGALGRLFGSLGQLLLGGLAIIAGVGLVLAIGCWFTGRGLHVHAHWARVSACILILLAMLPSCVLASSLHNVGRALMSLIVILCMLGLHALWTGYTSPAS